MKKLIKEVDKERGIVQITTFDERWYAKSAQNKETGLPYYLFVPSVTWIAGFYPKGIAFYKWLADKGWDESEAIKQAAGDKGSKVHLALEDLLAGEEVKIDSQYMNKSTGLLEELKPEEYEALLSFAEWFKETKPEIISSEIVLFSEKHGYAGTVDFICRIDGKLYIVDFKTGQNIWPEYELQVSAYKEALKETKIDAIKEGEEVGLAILRVGYRRNKHAYKFTEVEDKFDLFLAAKKIWANETAGQAPSQKDYPMALSLGLKKVEEEKPTKKEKK